MKFKNVFVVGKGRVALECAKIARSRFENVELLNLDHIQDKDMFFNELKNAFINLSLKNDQKLNIIKE